VSDCEELVGEVNHTTESVTDLEWIKVYQIINYHPSASGSYNYDV